MFVLKVIVLSSIMFYYYRMHIIVIAYTQLFDLLSLMYYLPTMMMIYWMMRNTRMKQIMAEGGLAWGTGAYDITLNGEVTAIMYSHH